MSGSDPEMAQNEEFWVRYPSIPDQRKVYFRVINRERAEIIGDGDEEIEEVSLYEVWRTDRETGLRPTSRSQTPWGEKTKQSDVPK